MNRKFGIVMSLALYALLSISLPISVHAESQSVQISANKTGEWKDYILEKHEVFLTWLGKNYPDKYEELMKVLNTQPDKFADQIENSLEIYDPIRRAQKHNPPLAKLLQEDLILKYRRDQLLKELQDSDGKGREKIVQQIKKIVSTRFDLITRIRTLQIQSLQRRLKKLQKDLEQKAAELETLKGGKDDNIDKRMKELLENTGINWE